MTLWIWLFFFLSLSSLKVEAPTIAPKSQCLRSNKCIQQPRKLNGSTLLSNFTHACMSTPITHTHTVQSASQECVVEGCAGIFTAFCVQQIVILRTYLEAFIIFDFPENESSFFRGEPMKRKKGNDVNLSHDTMQDRLSGHWSCFDSWTKATFGAPSAHLSSVSQAVLRVPS